VFVKSKGNLITRDELMDELWADTFVEENNLSQHISALRKALGKSDDETTFIETVPRHGYRFVADVKKVEAAIGNGNIAPDGSNRKSSRDTRGSNQKF